MSTIKEIERQLRKRGFTLAPLANGHKGIYDAEGNRVRAANNTPISIPSTTSDHRAAENLRAELRRAGVLRGPGRPSKQRSERLVAAAAAAPRIPGPYSRRFVETPVIDPIAREAIRAINPRPVTFACVACAVEHGQLGEGALLTKGWRCPFHMAERYGGHWRDYLDEGDDDVA